MIYIPVIRGTLSEPKRNGFTWVYWERTGVIMLQRLVLHQNFLIPRICFRQILQVFANLLIDVAHTPDTTRSSLYAHNTPRYTTPKQNIVINRIRKSRLTACETAFNYPALPQGMDILSSRRRSRHMGMIGQWRRMPRKYIRKTQRQSWASQEDPVLLILDGHLSHTKNLDVILKARENFVTLLCLPPYTTHKLQPLDVGVMFPFNTYMDQALETWMNNHPVRTVTARKKAKAEARLIENKTVNALKNKK
ncbi:hypothetical protein NQ318_022475 [Aromia moschata]|uniref:DDE-1 domain-containing protein n=1 Tax=Aromia moschata TaxID=1265417 RepID=A0AAV8Z6V6_9CUCU|nr:hypothetical protein NQ318_022475 [Aromia moschata]